MKGGGERESRGTSSVDLISRARCCNISCNLSVVRKAMKTHLSLSSVQEDRKTIAALTNPSVEVATLLYTVVTLTCIHRLSTYYVFIVMYNVWYTRR
jgi:hypothetical protein